MIIKKYNKEEDYDRIIKFLRDNYKENKSMVSWLPQRFDDLIYRIDVLYHDERGQERSSDYIYIFEDDLNNIIGLILPDGDSFNTCIKNGHENIFPVMLDLGEKELKPLFEKEEDGKINFLVVSHDSLKYQQDELLKRGYTKDEAGDFDNVSHPQETNYTIDLPEGFKISYGKELVDGMKSVACHYGFHPEFDDGDLTKENQEGPLSYQGRKKSQFFNDSFECLVVTDSHDICAYSFCYIDKETKTAFIEPVSTREKYRRKGLGTAMMHGIINKCKELGIKNCYVNSYDWRRKFYNAAGFETEDAIGFWHKKI